MATYRHAPHDRLRLRCGHRLVVAVSLNEHVAGRVAAARDRSADFVAVKHALDAGRVEGSIGSRFPFDLTSARAFPFNWLLTPELQ